MNKELNSILIAGVVAAAMLSAVPAFAQTARTQPIKASVASTATAYRFATVIKTQTLREPKYDLSGNLSDATLDTQLIYSPAYPDLESCKAANAAVSQLLGQNVSISAGSSTRKASISTASTTYSSSECLPSLGP